MTFLGEPRLYDESDPDLGDLPDIGFQCFEEGHCDSRHCVGVEGERDDHNVGGDRLFGEPRVIADFDEESILDDFFTALNRHFDGRAVSNAPRLSTSVNTLNPCLQCLDISCCGALVAMGRSVTE